MSKEDEAVETIIMYKAERIRKSEEHTKHIKEFLGECGINFKDIPVDVFKICAVDAMIFDVGAALNISVWKSLNKRKEMLGKIFPKK